MLCIKPEKQRASQLRFPMRVFPSCGGALLCFWVILLFTVSFCYGNDKTVLEVVGIGECADCEQSNIKTNHAFSGTVLICCFCCCLSFPGTIISVVHGGCIILSNANAGFSIHTKMQCSLLLVCKLVAEMMI